MDFQQIKGQECRNNQGKKIKFINMENILQSIMRQIVRCSQWIIKQVSVHEKHPTGAAGYVLKEDVTMWEARTAGSSWQDLQAHRERETHTGAGSLAGLVTPGETHAAIPGGLHPTEGTHSGVVHEELKPVGRTQIGEVQGVCFWRDSTLEQGRSVRRKEAEICE